MTVAFQLGARCIDKRRVRRSQTATTVCNFCLVNFKPQIALACEFHSYRTARDRPQGSPPENADRVAARETSPAKKRNQSGAGRLLAGGQFFGSPPLKCFV